MYRRLSLLQFSFKQTKLVFLLACMFSVVLGVIFEVSFHVNLKEDEQSIKIAICDQDDTEISNMLSKYLKNELNARIVYGDKYKMENQLITYRVTAGITIPKGFGKEVQSGFTKHYPVVTKFETDKIATLITMQIEAYINQVKADSNFLDTLKTEEAPKGNSKSYAVEKAFLGTIGFLPQVLMIMAICLASFLVNEKQEGNLMRIYISPVRFGQYVFGRGLVSVLASMIPVALLFVYAVIRQGGYKTYLLHGLATTTLFTLIMVLAGFYFGLRFATQNTAFLGIVGITSVGSIIGGCFFDVDKSIKLIQVTAKVFPHYWLMKGSRQFIENSTITGYQNGYIALFIYLVLIIILNYATYRKLDKNGGKIG